MGLGLGLPFAIDALDQLVARRRAERLQDEAVRESRRRFDLESGERRRQHDLQAEQQRLMNQYRQDQLDQQRQLREDVQTENFAKGTTPPMDISGSPMVGRLRAGGYQGFLRSTPEQQAAVGAGVLETQPSEPGYPEETPQLYQPGRDIFTGGAGYHEGRARAAEQAAREQERQADIGERAAAGLEETKRHNQAIEELRRINPPQGDRPYFQAYPIFDSAGVPTGALRFNARTGTMEKIDVPGGGQIKPPPGTTGRDIIGQEVATAQLNRLEQMFKPDFVGPAAGRVGMARQQVPLVPQDPEFANFAAATSAFRNAVIKAITGAQMSEPEANRIRQQIPEVTDPPTVWKAKAEQTRKNLADLEARISARQGGGTAAPSGVRRRRYNPATGQIE